MNALYDRRDSRNATALETRMNNLNRLVVRR
jgi:hypothetical protein